MGFFKKSESSDASQGAQSETPSGWTARDESVYQWYTQGEDRPNGREMFKRAVED